LAITACSARLVWVSQVVVAATYAVAESGGSACSSAHERDAGCASLVTVSFGEALGLAVRDKPGVRPAVVADGQGTLAQVDDPHLVRMAALHAVRMIVVTPVCRSGRAGRYLGNQCWPWHVIHGPPTSWSGHRVFTCNFKVTPEGFDREALGGI
jgi:hypothetical protein